MNDRDRMPRIARIAPRGAPTRDGRDGMGTDEPSVGDWNQQRLRRYATTRDRALRDALVHDYLPWARQLVRSYRAGSEPLDDVHQVAGVGLVKAIERFDPERGVAFRVFATPIVLGEVRHYFRDHCWRLHIPRRVKQQVNRHWSTIAEFERREGRLPDRIELAAVCGITREEADEVLRAVAAQRPQDVLPARSGEPVAEAARRLTTDGGVQSVERSLLLRQLAEGLDDRDRHMLRLRFYDGYSQRQIAAEIGVSQMHVSRLLRRALDRMRAKMERDSLVRSA